MKKLTLLMSAFVMLAVGSCNTPKSHVTYYIDYQKAGNGKVFITESNSVSFEYMPLGTILVEETPGFVEVTVPTTEKERQDDPLYGSGASTKTVKKYSNATAQSALNYAAEEALTLGGDGIINLRLSSYYVGKERIVQVSGMVIKRE